METLLNVREVLKSAGTTGPEQRPMSISETGVGQALLEELALKRLFLSGPFSIYDLSRHMRLTFEVANELFIRMRNEQLCQVNGMIGNVPTIGITTQGRNRALQLITQCQYTGPAPVSYATYVEQVRRQSVCDVEVHPADVVRAFSHLVLDDTKLWQLGTALNSGSSVFLYGPPGMGKTAIAETLCRVFAADSVWIPHAVEVDGQIITVYDPSIHHLATDAESAAGDERWMRCQRPAVLVGGELTIEMLDLQFNASTNFYVAPSQMKANNGVLIIDDFGRQRMRPEDLLNRWVVPMDRRIDFLSLAGGMKIEIPFEMLIVFASNIDPYKLVDAAFLRRIQTKIKVDAVTDDQFCEIFRRVATERGIEFNLEVAHFLIDFIRNDLKQQLRPCYPRDILNQMCWAAKFEGRRPTMDRQYAMFAVEAYLMPSD